MRKGLPTDPETTAGRRAKMRTVLIFDGYYATLGGNQNYICMLLAAGGRGRWRPVLACSGEGRLAEAARAAGGEVHIIPQPRLLDRSRGEIMAGGMVDRARTALALLSYNFRLLPLLLRLRPDVVQCHSTRNVLMAGFAARLTGTSMMLFVKGALDTPFYDRIAVGLARRTVFLTEALKPDWLMPRNTLSPGKYSVLPIGIKFDSVDAAEERATAGAPDGLALMPGAINFVFAGWLAPGKGVDILIEAFAQAIARRPECRLHILGASDDDGYIRRLHDLAARLAPENTVRFLGWRKDILDVLAAVDSFVLPSLSEGVPRSIVESMALGKAVIATRVGGVPALLGNGAFGIVVDPGDVAALANALVRVASEPELRADLGRKARAEARSQYAFEAHLDGLWSALDSTCQ